MITRTPVKPIQSVMPFIAEDNPHPPIVFFYEKPTWDDRSVEAHVTRCIEAGHYIRPSNYPLLKSYNGATGQERRDGGNKWGVAVELGFAPRATICSVCSSRVNLQSHNENYFRPCNARPVCSGCHRLLHRRFFDPNTWLAKAYQHRYTGCWFGNIALHPLSREQSLFLATCDDPFDVRQL